MCVCETTANAGPVPDTPAKLRHVTHTPHTQTCSPANALSDPAMMIAPTSLSASIKRSASVSSAMSAMLSALSALGLLSVTSATRDAGRDAIMFSYFASKADAGDAEDADAVVDMDMDVNVDVVNRVRAINVGLRGEEKKVVVVRVVSWRRKTDMMW